jgi:hypothetical protein
MLSQPKFFPEKENIVKRRERKWDGNYVFLLKGFLSLLSRVKRILNRERKKY